MAFSRVFVTTYLGQEYAARGTCSNFGNQLDRDFKNDGRVRNHLGITKQVTKYWNNDYKETPYIHIWCGCFRKSIYLVLYMENKGFEDVLSVHLPLLYDSLLYHAPMIYNNKPTAITKQIRNLVDRTVEGRKNWNNSDKSDNNQVIYQLVHIHI